MGCVNTEPTPALAPDFALMDAISGDTISPGDHRGKVVLLDFFATWCGGCRYSIDNDLVPLHEQYGDWIIFLSIDIGEPDITAKEMQTFAEEHDMGWPILMGSNSIIDQSYNVQVLPTIYIIDEDGVIRYSHLGSPGIDVLESEIDSLLD